MRRRRIGRREFIRISAISGLALGVGTALTRRLLDTGELTQVEDTRGAMGTYVRLVLVTPDPGEGRRATAAMFDRISRLEAVLSAHRPDSALGRLNTSGHARKPPAELLEVMRRARQVSELTGGAFDITVRPLVTLVERAASIGRLPTRDQIHATLPRVGFQRIQISDHDIAYAQDGMSVTLDGIAKGYVVDEALAELAREGFPQAMVDAGGDIGGTRRPDGSGWRIGVQDPRRESGATLAVARLAGNAMATSGDYLHAYTADFSQHHIVDPRSGLSPIELSSVSVMASSACLADGLSTGVMVLGPRRGMALIERLPDVEGLLVTKSGESIASSGFPVTGPSDGSPPRP
jgi:thiamine biosynthesis lipoprotein